MLPVLFWTLWFIPELITKDLCTNGPLAILFFLFYLVTDIRLYLY